MQKWAIFTSIAFQMGAVIAGGVFLGVWLDKKYPNQYKAYTVIFSLLGVFAGIYLVVKQLNDINKKDS